MNYEVVSQVEGYSLDPTVGAVQVMNITARTIPNNVAFTVQVPIDDYTAAHVQQVLSERAATIEQVHAGQA